MKAKDSFMLRTPRLRALAILFVLALLGAACSGENPDQSEGDTAGGTPTEAGTEEDGSGDSGEETEDSEDGGEADGDRTIRIAATDAADTLDPTDATGIVMEEIAKNVFDGLTEATPDATDVRPGLAEEWEASEDGRTWTFHLREDAVFQDGTPVNADAVVFTLDWLLREENPGRSSGRFTIIDSYEAVDEHTVTISTEEPVGLIPGLMATTWAGIISPTAFEELGDEWHRMPVGSGPFQVVESETERVVLERFEDYWRGPAEGVQRIEWIATPEPFTRIAMLESGDADIAHVVTPDEVPEIEQNEELAVREVNTLENRLIYLNHLHEPLQDVRVREALAISLDIPTMIDTVMSGYANYSGALVNSAIPDSVGDFYSYDPERARQLLEEAGYGDGSLSLNLWTSSGSAQLAQEFMQAAQAQWAAAGVNVEVTVLDSGTFSDAYNVPPEEGTEKHMVEAGPGGLPPHPHAQLWDRFRSDLWTPEGRNMGYYSNERVDELLLQGIQEPDPEARAPYYIEAQEILRDEVAAIPMYESVMLHGHRRDVADLFVTTPFQLNVFHQHWREG